MDDLYFNLLLLKHRDESGCLCRIFKVVMFCKLVFLKMLFLKHEIHLD